MCSRLSIRLFGILLLISLSSVCIADSEEEYQLFVQGGESTITNEANNTYILTVQNIIPHFQYISDGLNNLAPIQDLSATTPKTAIVSFYGVNHTTNKTSITSGEVTGISFSNDYTTLNLTLQPPQYFIRGGLEPSRTEEIGLDAVHPENNTKTRIYLYSLTVPE